MNRKELEYYKNIIRETADIKKYTSKRDSFKPLIINNPLESFTIVDHLNNPYEVHKYDFDSKNIIGSGIYFWVAKKEINTTVLDLLHNVIPRVLNVSGKFVCCGSSAANLNLFESDRRWDAKVKIEKGEVIYIGKAQFAYNDNGTLKNPNAIIDRCKSHHQGYLSSNGNLAINLRKDLRDNLDLYYCNKLIGIEIKAAEKNVKRTYTTRFGN
ncbi:MAG: hypothetical protein R3Y21_04695 [Mycoplasmatota bacterium]